MFASPFRARCASALFLSFVLGSCAITLGCNSDYTVEVDISTPDPRFILDGRTWGWPFRWPRVNALAIGADEESMWEIESVDPRGVPARQFAIVYGELPEGFVQTHPKQDRRPKRLTQNRNYFVGAGGPDNEIYRTVFALPVDAAGRVTDPDFEPDRQKVTFPEQPPTSPKPAE